MNVAHMNVDFERQIAFGKLTLAEQRASEDELFAALIQRQAKFVYGVAYSILRNAHDAEDVVQDTFLKLYRTSSWKGMNEERAYLARASWRLAVDRLPRAGGETPEVEVRAGQANPEEQVLASDWNAAVHRLIDALPEELRQPIALSTVEELKSHEIAQIIGIPEGTVRTRLMKARQVLRQKLEALKVERYAK